MVDLNSDGHPAWLDTLIVRLGELAQKRIEDDFDDRVDERIDRKIDKLKMWGLTWALGLWGTGMVAAWIVASMVADVQNDIAMGQRNDAVMVTQEQRASDKALHELKDTRQDARLNRLERFHGFSSEEN